MRRKGSASMALRTVSGCTPSSWAMVPTFQCSALEVASNLRAGFGTDHPETQPSSWNTRERVKETPGASTDPQHSICPAFFPANGAAQQCWIAAELL
jgi:hypothetical protein